MGRKSKSQMRAHTELTLAESAPWAAQHLSLIAQGKLEKPNAVRTDVCKYVINQAIGAPTQKTVIAGDKDAPLQTFVFVLSDGSRLKPGDLIGSRNKAG